MANTFTSLKKNRNLDKLAEQLKKASGGNNYDNDDDKYWKLTTDKAGNGRAVIRFLPAPPNEDLPYVSLWSHGFQGPTGQWYIENSLTTLGKDDPVSEYNGKLWNSGIEANKEIARKQKRKLNFYSNIYVVSDPANPENEGKVFLFRYGKTIFDMLNALMNPEFDDQTPVNPFDFWEGVNFNLRARKADGYIKYDRSDFSDPKPLFDDDDKLEELWKTQHSLQEIVGPDKFKSYEELSARLAKVLNLNGNESTDHESNAEEAEPEMEMKPAKEKKAAKKKETPAPSAPEEDDEDLSEFFNNLINDDE